MNVLFSALILSTVLSLGTVTPSWAADPTPEQLCAHIKKQDCYRAIECNKLKRQFKACVAEKTEMQTKKQGNPKPK